jgi:hypothetical protein
MKDAQKEFGIVRMGGTIGWIFAAWPFTFILVDWAKVDAARPEGFVAWLGAVLANGLTGEPLQDATKWTYIVAGVASLVLAAFSLTLPHTPPKAAVEGEAQSLAWLQAAKLLKHPFVLILWIVAFIDSFVHNCYFNWTGTFLSSKEVGIPGNWVMPVMSIGQIAEILTMFVLGGLAYNDDRWSSGTRSAVCCLLVHASERTDHCCSDRSRDLLRILLCDCLHLCGRAFSKGRSIQRAGFV